MTDGQNNNRLDAHITKESSLKKISYLSCWEKKISSKRYGLTESLTDRQSRLYSSFAPKNQWTIRICNKLKNRRWEIFCRNVEKRHWLIELNFVLLYKEA